MSKFDSSYSSEDLLIAFREQHWSVIENVIRDYSGILLRGALSLGFRGQNADDLVQNVWVTFFEKLPDFKGNSQLKTFLFGILINKSRELRREKIKFEQNDPIDSVMESRFNANGFWLKPPEEPSKIMEVAQSMEQIYDCIEKLPLTQRAAFCMWEIDENETNEICKILDVSVTNLGVILFRAKNKLRECIELKSKR